MRLEKYVQSIFYKLTPHDLWPQWHLTSSQSCGGFSITSLMCLFYHTTFSFSNWTSFCFQFNLQVDLTYPLTIWRFPPKCECKWTLNVNPICKQCNILTSTTKWYYKQRLFKPNSSLSSVYLIMGTCFLAYLKPDWQINRPFMQCIPCD